MIRVALSSRDYKLQPLLAPALGRDFHVFAEADRERLKRMLFEGAFDLLLLDLDANFGEPEEAARFYDEITESGVGVVAMTDDIARPTAIELVQRGVHNYCRKPPVIRELKAMMRRACEHAAMKRELEEKRQLPIGQTEPAETPRCDGLIGASNEMRKVYDLIRRVANLNASVLITGESGTGKELIARAIHNLGDRRRSPFVAVSCGAIPETLIESELFGHEKGAFTGTTGTRTGYFEQAGSGTLLLDEIGELSLQTQVKLLRVLQQREFIRLGSGRAIPLKARVIFATHRDLSRMVGQGAFRLDLFYRINIMTISAPSLADRPEDIPELARYFVRQYSNLYNKCVLEIAPSALARLQEYEWPGNVRELENAIQTAIICADTDTIQVADLPQHLRNAEATEEADLPQVGSFERLLRDFKMKVAMKAIEDCRGNKTLAARSLSISRAYLHRLIRPSEGPEAVDAAS